MTIRGYISITDLERLVNKKLYDIGITSEDYPIDPFELIHNENILLQETPFDNMNIRGMTVNGNNLSGIMVNSNYGFYARRFIAMHELSHFWFHPHKTKRVCLEEYSKLKRGEEWQANNAAAIALMPADIVTDLYYYCDGDIEYMCEYFRVGKDSMKYRLESLSLTKPKITTSESSFICFGRDPMLNALENHWLYGG